MLGDPSMPLTSRLQAQTIIPSAPPQPDPSNEPAAALQRCEPGLIDCSKEAGHAATTEGQDELPASKRPCLAYSRGSDSDACDASMRMTPDDPQRSLRTSRQGQSSLLPAASGQPSSSRMGVVPDARQEQACCTDRACRAAGAGPAATAGTEPEAKEHNGHADKLEGTLHREPRQAKQQSRPLAAAHARAHLSLQAAHAPAKIESPEHPLQPAASGHKAGNASAVPPQALPLNGHESMTGNGIASCSKPETPAASDRNGRTASLAAASPKQMGYQDEEAQAHCSEASLDQEAASLAELLVPGAGSSSAADAGLAR